MHYMFFNHQMIITQYDDHINCVKDADELAEQANLMDVMYAGENFLQMV